MCRMNHPPVSIRDRVEVRLHPTVVRLDDLDSGDAGWLSDSFVLTPDLENHLFALRQSFNRDRGCGVFLIGHYGSGKSHFLAYLVEQLRSQEFSQTPLSVAYMSLVNFRSDKRLEDIVCELLDIKNKDSDRRNAWKSLIEKYTNNSGLVLVLDELSEFLRSKENDRSFTEDIRFLQFMGEWAQSNRLWIVAAMQEAIEHTGELEYSLYRKIKDRYPLRLFLPPTHVHALIADGILKKKPEYENAVIDLLGDISTSFPGIQLDFEQLKKVYPIHPATLDLLEEVRDRFSQARGIVDFTVSRLAGDDERGISAFLDKPWGFLLTPDVIVDHFSDLFELQPEFMPLAQQILPWYRKNMSELFENAGLRTLANQLLKILILVYLSPARDHLSASQAAEWLLFDSIHSDPSKNLSIIQKVLSKLAHQGRYIVEEDHQFRLNLREDSRTQLNKLLDREIERLQADQQLILDDLVSLLAGENFNPFVLPRNRWQRRRVTWHFHEREYSVWFGEENPELLDGIGFYLRMPWGDPVPFSGCYGVLPASITVNVESRELAALIRLNLQPLSPEIKKLVEKGINVKKTSFIEQLQNCWNDAVFVTPEGNRERVPRLEKGMQLDNWLDILGLIILRRNFPGFERFAPSYGPLPKEAWIQFMRFVSSDDIGKADANDYVRLIREAYLVPMGLLRRKGTDYVVPNHLEHNELISLLIPMLNHSPSPKTVHQRFAEPIYGLVPEQTNMLLIFMSIQGEIDILKDRHSYRDSFETLPNPLSYDRIELGHALSTAQLNVLAQLCQALNIKVPKRWTVLAQKQTLEKIREKGRQLAEQLNQLLRKLNVAEEPEQTLSNRLVGHLRLWAVLQKKGDLLFIFEEFLSAVNSIDTFLDELQNYCMLQKRLPALIDEVHRYQHLFENANYHKDLLSELSDSNQELQKPPNLNNPDKLENWLVQARILYTKTKKLYTERHRKWWNHQDSHSALHWRPPVVAESKHVGLGSRLTEIKKLQNKALRARCQGLVNLDFQPLCSCGFNGKSGPTGEILDECATLQRETDERLKEFFAQLCIKNSIASWENNGQRLQEDLSGYLSGVQEIPEIRDLSWFDQKLSGEASFADIDLGNFATLLEEKTWQPEILHKFLDDQLREYSGQRIRFVNPRQSFELGKEIISWCAEQCMKFGVPLPKGMNSKELRRISDSLRPEWVSDAALQNLEQLGLDSKGISKLLEWLINGQISMPDEKSNQHNILFAAQEFLYPQNHCDARSLAVISEAFYRYHTFFIGIAGNRWLDRLDELAAEPILPKLLPLTEYLEKNQEAQWLLLDCWGLPLFDPVMEIISSVFYGWETVDIQFAIVSEKTTTDRCYMALLDTDLHHCIDKCNVIDQTLHQRSLVFPEFIKIIKTELEIALARLYDKFDPSKDLLIFADHGFRMDKAGRRFQHGGDSTLERVVPVCLMSSQQG